MISSRWLSDLSLPVIVAPMFLVSNPRMVIESCLAGLVGTFPLLNARTTVQLDQWMTSIAQELTAFRDSHPEQKIGPWGVNLIVHRSNKRWMEDTTLIRKHQPPIVITSLGNPASVVEFVHDYGGIVLSDVSTITHARKAADCGVDGLILVCNGAGGHGGTIHPYAFVAEVKRWWKGITILAGCISNGQHIRASIAIGADAVYMGTRFIATVESGANDAYRQMLIESTLDDIIYTDAVSGVKANYLKSSLENAGISLSLSDPHRHAGMVNLDTKAKAWKDIWSAGQGVGDVDRVLPLSELVNQLKQEFRQSAGFTERWNTLG
ncbi:nitronate monooxygenase [Paenibacillus sp. ACRRX]|uniref:NAD(P)H-dependent flavin oxidoreductase n=1 Tax=unclassified Paenibacillus TaxID=185978 RepID=UPI001EF5013C|nr:MULTISPECIES: nitronate monooxygenase [unclassified Paenibacillus]MCG7407250.1 nitronate monooxygenase [Paenibacillus sp. ACRRX]MDK8180469.1 nitronate monooxygenase [Paenibacillus sp. UMB4589-SE434]